MIPELVTILAAVIAAAASLVAITLSKEQKISEFRQAWIDALRSDLAAFFSSARAFNRSMEAQSVHGLDTTDPAKKLFTPEKVGEIRLAAAESLYRIKLRLNPDEPEHRELLRLLWQAIADQNAALENGEKRDVLAAVDRAADFAAPILKTEWNRVKAGEKPFRTVRVIATLVIGGCVLGFLMIWHQTPKVPAKAPEPTNISVIPPPAQGSRRP